MAKSTLIGKEIVCMENSYRFFANTSCEYYPCHKGVEELNCLFCYCPLYERAHCPGNPEFIPKHPAGGGENSAGDGQRGYIKSCMHCTFPHRAENYDIIMQFLK